MGVKQVHVSGVGFLGACVLWELANLRVPFTWDDNETGENGWASSIGAILPYPDKRVSRDADGYRFWRDYRASAPWFASHLKPVSVTYAFKGLPENLRPGRFDPVGSPTADGMKFWTGPAHRLDVPGFVQETRDVYKESRLPARPLPVPDVTLLCHGVTDAIAKPLVAWGWSALIRIEPTEMGKDFWLPESALRFGDPNNPTFSYYVFPTGTPEIWRGGYGRTLSQTPKSDDVRLKDRFEKFQVATERVWGAWLTCTYGAPEHGWSPEPRGKAWRGDGPSVRTFEDGKAFIPRPIGITGVQIGPLQAWELICAAGLNTT